MCWSATADTVAGTVVSAVGIATLACVRRPRDAVLAAVPLVLGAHQLIEAVVWRGEEGEVSDGVAELARNVWAFIAFPLLPFMVPLGVLLAVWPQSGPGRRRLLGGLFAVGAVASAALAKAQWERGVDAHIHGHTVQYSIGIPNAHLVIAAYLVATLGALLASGDRPLVRFGVVGALGAAFCAWMWTVEFASTWCALAAVGSVMLLAWVRGRPSERKQAGDRALGTVRAGS
ncbi:DUF6629 family protein [Yinghuangia seranimata]|uniref:DUF6629 family protein n=1 Tax=Yinghuangia seranimata TaxID=408067 RepID=UPI00248C233B|nr:DUF6629 family protein [Yinghuangia seranimata]MDI2125871.1 hypothetical protein [Yinghuangia seranimata]